MNQTIFEGIRGDNENFIVLLYDFDLCQNSAHVKLHSSNAEQCEKVKYLQKMKILDSKNGNGILNVKLEF